MKPQMKLKMYGSAASACRASNGRPFIRVGSVYIVPLDPNGTYDIAPLQVEIVCDKNDDGSRVELLKGGAVTIGDIDKLALHLGRSYRLPK